MNSAPMGTVATSTAGGVRTLRIDRPERLGAVDVPTMCELIDGLADAVADPDVRCVVLTGTGRAFSAGADLQSLTDPGHTPRATELMGRADGMGGQSPTTGGQAMIIDVCNRFVLAVTEAPIPVVAAVNGLTVGVGNSFALASDLVLISSSASVSFGFSKIGLMPDGGATALAPARMGRGPVARLLYLEETIDAAEAARVGWADEVMPAASFEQLVAERAATLAAGPGVAWAKSKESLAAGLRPDLLRAMQAEADGQLALAGTADHRHAARAFAAGEKPTFTGKE